MGLTDEMNMISFCTADPCTAPGYVAFGRSCYLVYRDKATWTKAESRCRQDGGHLASVHSEAEHNFLVTQMLVFVLCFKILYAHSQRCYMEFEGLNLQVLRIHYCDAQLFCSALLEFRYSFRFNVY